MVKLSKAEVRYEIAKPDQDHCAECKWYLDETTCELVEGRISPQGWCKVFHRATRRPRDLGADRAYVRRMRSGDVPG